MKNNLPIYILLCLLNLSWVHARNRQQEAETLIKKSVDALYNNPKQASYYAAKVIELFPEERQNDQKAEAMFYYSQAEKLLGNFDVSIKNLYDALEYATPTNKGEFYQFNLSSCIRQQNSLTAQFVSFSLSNLANIFYPPNFYNN